MEQSRFKPVGRKSRPGTHQSGKRFDYNDLATVDDEIRADAVNYIKQHANDEKPFFHVCLLYEGA